MSKLAVSSDPIVALQQQVDLLRLWIEQLQKANPFNNASVESGEGISAGAYQIAPSGVVMPWQGGSSLVGDAMQGVKNTADGAQSTASSALTRANQAYDSQALKPTTLWVQARLDNLQSQINNAASSGDVSAVQTELTNFKAQYAVQHAVMVGKINAAIEAMEVRPGYSRPTPIPYG